MVGEAASRRARLASATDLDEDALEVAAQTENEVAVRQLWCPGGEARQAARTITASAVSRFQVPTDRCTAAAHTRAPTLR